MSFSEQTLRPAYDIADTQSALLRSVFWWMTVGLVITGFVSMFVANTPTLIETVASSPGLLLFLLFAELGLVFWLSARVMKMSAKKATGVFLLYSALNGITLAPLCLVYTGASIASTFMVAGGMFGGMALFGTVTKKDLSGMGSFLMMGLWGIILAMIANFFFQSPGLSFGISVIGVIVFTGLTAWDTQKIKNMGAQVRPGDSSFQNYSIIGALTLYLDFINLFIMLLRLMGDRR